ncbi:MAG: threonine--tRNA ligase [Firmicutes bacterium]|nr:threonine--tRNA ligase [Bacillota bacterium]
MTRFFYILISRSEAVNYINLKLPDDSIMQVKKGTTVQEVAYQISPRLAKDAVCGRYNGDLVDLQYPINADGTYSVVTIDSPEGIDVLRHTTAHVMAQAVLRLWPDAKLAIGPTIENGFYYDFDLGHSITPEDLETIEAEMHKIIADDLPVKRFEVSKDEAAQLFKERNDNYKLELIADLDNEVSIYQQGDFFDLCRGPHLSSTGRIKAFKLLSVAGAYWRGDDSKPMLQRIYGTAFFKKSDLDAYLKRMEEAKKRDHRKVGRELELFVLLEEGPGFPFLLPKGMELRNTLIDFWREEHKKAGYLEISTPIILHQNLWHRSGHWDHYKENMYFTKIDGEDYAIKPMNCPGGMLVYKNKMHSYRDLPLRLGELGLVHRHELSGVLHGLMRVRNFTQDDAHIFMLPEQIKDEITDLIAFIDKFYSVFGFKYHMELSTRPENSMGSDEDWEVATNALKAALEENGYEYILNEGDGAFYGPKIDFHLEDCLGRTWQCGTIQLDFQMPERFDLTYVGQDGEKHRPVMIHRVVFGSIERFIGIIIEHFAGAFPTWLAPVQVRVIPIAQGHHEYATVVADQLSGKGIRLEIDQRNEKLGYKIREAQMQKIPYMLIVGDQEKENNSVAVRSREEGDLGTVSLDEFTDNIAEEINSKTL